MACYIHHRGDNANQSHAPRVRGLCGFLRWHGGEMSGPCCPCPFPLPLSPSEIRPEQLRLGGLVGFMGYDVSSLVIEGLTWSLPFVGLSHVALVVPHPDEGTAVLLESTTFCKRPCLVGKQRISGVQYQPIRQRVAEYFGRAYYYPLIQLLTTKEIIDLDFFAGKQRGRTYDYLGAFRSRATPGGLISWAFCQENLSRLFCSELCAAGLREVGRFEDRNCSVWNPNRLCRHQVRTGRHGRPLRIVTEH